MTPAENEKFTIFLLEKAKRAKQEAGYPATQFVNMLNAQGGESTALSLLSSSKPPSDGFVKLWEKGRVDLTVEALILESEWITHFSTESLEIARKRLLEVKYPLNEFQPMAALAEAKNILPGTEQAIAADIEALENSAETVWKISGPPENFLTAIQRGFWALNDGNVGSWHAIQPGDLVVFHSIRKSRYVRNPPSAVVGFARVGRLKYRKDEHWWLAEIEENTNHWPHAFSIEDACLVAADMKQFDFNAPFESKSEQVRTMEVAAILARAIPMTLIEEAARKILPTSANFPLTGSIARLSEAYRRAVLSNRDWAPTEADTAEDELELALLSESERSEIAAQTYEAIMAAAMAYQDPEGPSHKERTARVRIEDAKQKYRIACLEDFTCQVCHYRQGYLGKRGVQRWIIQVDHIIQKSDKGGENLGNLWVLCPRCHSEKTYGVLQIDPSTYVVTRLGTPIGIRNNHLPMTTPT